jgi:hypothetical protein
MMKVIGLMSTAALLSVLAAPVPSFAQGDKDNHEEAAKPERQPTKAEPARHEEETKPAAQEQAKPGEQANRPQPQRELQAKPIEAAKQSQPQPQPAQRNQQAESEDRRAQPSQAKQENNGNSVHQQPQHSVAEQQRQRSEPALRLSTKGNGRIPDDRFHSSFGSDHRFRIGNPTVVAGYSRFRYGGYWFGFVQPWPVGWYYTDDVYVDYLDGGYFLCNPSYPGDRIAISVVI